MLITIGGKRFLSVNAGGLVSFVAAWRPVPERAVFIRFCFFGKMWGTRRIGIEEKDGVQKIWFKEAGDVSLRHLPAYINGLMTVYGHDYGTICYALAAGAITTMWAMNKSPEGGITGFQSGCIMWEVIKNWGSDNKGPMRLMKYCNMLYPQYEDDFARTISPSTWSYLQKEAKARLQEPGGHPKIREHWQNITAGRVPFGFIVKSE